MLRSKIPAIIRTVYTDGSCLNNQSASNSVGGWAWQEYISEYHIPNSVFRTNSGSSFNTTNNKMELTAIIDYLENTSPPCNINLYSDSMYCLKGLVAADRLKEGAILDKYNPVDGWYQNWQARGFNKVKNVDLWKSLYEIICYHINNDSDIILYHVKAHSSNIANNQVDLLARGRALEIS